ncbi:hypothetical protein [Nocardiopsis sp. FR4]|uniref:TRAFAC clade GTPase domain-containing protein n=1 Tax=Nocardiopsis sp. FR4 TaxID=2605985 RepID=UPI00135AC1BB|nr:hypothetical protein [Nocardiopsis sp. FR4]
MSEHETAPPGVRCPVCLSRVVLDHGRLWLWKDGEHRALEVPDGATPEQRRRLLRRAQVRCPNQAGEVPEHHLPYQYVSADSDPVVVALIGSYKAGKTHLLASMVGAIQNQGLEQFGLSASPLDVRGYEEFTNTKVRPLLDRGEMLDRTSHDVWEFEVGLMVGDAETPSAPPRAVTFFDVSGEVLGTAGQAEKQVFLDTVDGFLFVFSTEDMRNERPETTFATVLDLVADKQDKAAVLVMSKADLFRFEHPVDRWLRDGVRAPDAERVEEETRDLYAFVSRYDKGRTYLRPWFEFGRTAIHAASATGGPPLPEGRAYARPVRPQRALQPFLTLMAATGVLGGAEARKVGR